LVAHDSMRLNAVDEDGQREEAARLRRVSSRRLSSSRFRFTRSVSIWNCQDKTKKYFTVVGLSN
jgi:hypothetical protein